MLSEQHRTKLDGIVKQMVVNKEQDSDIEFVVNDFKSKYDPSVATANVKPKTKSLGQKALGIAKGTQDFINQQGQPLIDIAAMPVQGLAKMLGQPDPYADNAMAGIKVNSLDQPTMKLGSLIQVGAMALPVGRMAAGGAMLARAAGIVKGASAIGKIGSGAAAGYSFDVGTNLQNGEDPLKAELGTAISALFPAAGVAKNITVRFAKKQASRVINSLIKPLANDFSYGKNPGRAVAEEGIVGNSFEDLEQNIRTRRQEIGQAIGDLGDMLSIKWKQIKGKATLNIRKSLLDIRKSLSPLDEAAKQAASQNNPTLLKRILEIKTAITDKLEPYVDDQGVISIKSVGKKKLYNLDFSEARDVLGEIGDHTRFTGNPTDDQLVNAALKSVYGKVKEATLKYAESIDPAIASQFRDLTEKYADLHSAEIATKYRDKIVQRSNLIGLSPQIAGIGSALLAFVATGGEATSAILAGVSGAALDKLVMSPGFKTRLAAVLSGQSKEALPKMFQKVPALSHFFPEGGLRSPGDLFLDHID